MWLEGIASVGDYAGRTRRKKGTWEVMVKFFAVFLMLSFWCFEIFATGVQKDRINIFDAYSHLFTSLARVTRIHKLSGQ
jgi:hypothetical protein